MTIIEINSLQLIDQASKYQTYQSSMEDRVRANKVAEYYDSLLEDASPDEDAILTIQESEVSQAEVDAEFEILKEMLRKIEIERLRVEDLKDRLAALSDHNASHNRLNPEVPNRNAWMNKNIVRQEDKILAESNLKALEAADKVVKDERSLVAYKELRRADYPSLEDQLDSIYHNGMDAWKAEIQAVKDKHPKP